MQQQTINQQLFDAMVERQIYLMQYADSLSMRMKRRLTASEQAMKDRILGRLDGWEGIRTQADKKKLDTAIEMVIRDRGKAWDAIKHAFNGEIQGLSRAERDNYTELLDETIPFAIPIPKLTDSDIARTVKGTLLNGQTIPAWLNQLQSDDSRRITESMMAGAISGESASTIAQRVLGTVSLKGADGAIQAARTAIDALSTGAVNLTAGAVRDTLTQGSKVFDKVVFVSVLDSRTSSQCRALDGKQFDMGKVRIPPLHPRCRSKLIPLVKFENMERYALKPKAEEEYLNEYMKGSGLKTRTDLPRNERADYDTWLKQRLKRGVGKQPERTTYQDWLKRQPQYLQEHILGKEKARMFRNGEVTLDKFVNINGKELTVEQLKLLSKRNAP